MKTLEQIREIIAKHKGELRGKYKIKEIGIFGSYARGEYKDKSDVDILVEYEKPVSLLQIISLENYLSALIGMKVDLVPKKNIRHELREFILREVIVL